MANTIKIPRTHLIMGLCLPLAVLLGYLLAEPLDSASIATVVMVLAVFSVPALMKWHHPLLVLGWNVTLALFILPGSPQLWVVLAPVCLLFAVLNRSVDPFRRFIWVPSLIWPVVFLGAVVFGTALVTGGIGLRIFGSAQQGGKNYVLIFAAIAGFFAFSSQRIPADRVALYVGMFFLPGLMSAIPDLAAFGGQHFGFLPDLLGANASVGQVVSGPGLDPRIPPPARLTTPSVSLRTYPLALHGISRRPAPARP